MSTVSLTTDILTRARDLFTLYSKKSAFNLEEYADVGAVFKRVSEALEASQTSGTADLDEIDVKYLVSAVNVCSQRVPTEVQNYKPIADLVEVLVGALKTDDAEEKSSVTEL